MGLFRQKIALESLEDRVRKLEHEVEDAERHAKLMRLEWEETYDKVRHAMSRFAKRDALAKKENGPDLPLGPEVPTDDGLDSISRSILLRRGVLRQAE